MNSMLSSVMNFTLFKLIQIPFLCFIIFVIVLLNYLLVFLGLPPLLYPIVGLCESSDDEAPSAGEETTMGTFVSEGPADRPSSSNFCPDSTPFPSSMTEEDPIQSKGKEADKSEERLTYDSIVLERKKDELRNEINQFVDNSPRVSSLSRWLKMEIAERGDCLKDLVYNCKSNFSRRRAISTFLNNLNKGNDRSNNVVDQAIYNIYIT